MEFGKGDGRLQVPEIAQQEGAAELGSCVKGGGWEMQEIFKNSLVGFVASYCTLLLVGLAVDILHTIRGISVSSFLYTYVTDPTYILLCLPLSWLIGWIIRSRVLNKQPTSP